MVTYLTKALRLIEESTSDLSEQQLTTSHKGRWSAAQILEHLARAFGSTAKAFEQQLESGELLPIRPLTIKDRVGIFLVVKVGYFPEGRKAPEWTVPSDAPGGAASLQRIKQNLDRMATAIDRAEQKWGSEICVLTHPILGPLTVPQWRKFHFVHTRHHMKQVRQRAQTKDRASNATSA
jgi:DinB superfamily